jgi:hypothetical protein
MVKEVYSTKGKYVATNDKGQDHSQTTMRNLGFTEVSAPKIGGYKEDSTEEATFEASQVHDLAKTNLDFLAGLSMPTVFEYSFPPVFLIVWAWLVEYAHKERDFSQLALGLPRGFGKTTVIKLYILYCILFTNKKFILICSSRIQLAVNIIADVMDMLNEKNIIAVFGDWKLGVETDKQELKKFGFRGRTIILAATGAEGSIRGLNLKQERPDVMIFEDVQTRENADSPLQAETLEQWMVGTAMKAKSPRGCLFLFIGNMYPTKNSILRKLKANPRWIKFIAGGILADGTSLWEELQPIKQLLAEYESDCAMGHPEIFHSEVLNDENASATSAIDMSRLPPYPFADDEPIAGNFIIIDPATDKPGSDAVSIGGFNVYNAVPTLMYLEEGRFSPGETIRTAIKMALKMGCRCVAIEANSYQYTLKYWSEFICQQMGITGIEFVEVYSGSFSKNSRILGMFKSLLAGEIHTHPDHKVAVALQVANWNPLRRDNTDGLLDLLTYSPKIIELYPHLVTMSDIILNQEASGIEVWSELDNSCF